MSERAKFLKPIGFEHFIEHQEESIRRIARGTPDRLSPQDVAGEAYVAACEVGGQRGLAVDLREESEQQRILGRIYNRCVKFVRSRWWDVRLDHAPRTSQTDDSSARPLWERLEAPPSSEPLAQLLEVEEQEASRNNAPQVAYSELSAYRTLLSRFESSIKQLAKHLSISPPTLRKRIRNAGKYASMQIPLFTSDGLDDGFLTRSAWLSKLCPDWSRWRQQASRKSNAARPGQQLELLP